MRQDLSGMGALGVLVLIVVAVGVLVSVGLAAGGDPYRRIGRGGDMEPAGERGDDRELEIRQMLVARNARRQRRGEQALDVDAELERLLRGGGDGEADDPALVAEVRALVVARNARRQRRGEQPLDVEAEVQAELRRVRSGRI